MVDKWLHISELGGDPWILPIWNAVNDAVARRSLDPPPNELFELGGFISIRLNMLPRIIRRINMEVEKLYRSTESHESKHVYQSDVEGCAFKIDNDIKYNLLIDIDSILFELNSVCDLMSSLLAKLYLLAGKSICKKKVGLELKRLFFEEGFVSGWFQKLDNHRNFFVHEGAPYLAVDITKGLGEYDLIIMKKNLTKFDDPDEFFRLSDVNQIVSGFVKAKPIIQKKLIKTIKNDPNI